jgi:hypothetical protein
LFKSLPQHRTLTTNRHRIKILESNFNFFNSHSLSLNASDNTVYGRSPLNSLMQKKIPIFDLIWICLKLVIAFRFSVNYFALIKLNEKHTFREETWWFKRGSLSESFWPDMNQTRHNVMSA